MRISESRIRRIIREEARRVLREGTVDEMAYAGDLGVRHSKHQERDSFISSELSGTSNRKGAEKYAGGEHFRALARKHFDNIPYDVWVAPLIGVGHEAGVSDDPEDERRGRVMKLVPDGIKLLEEIGFESPARVGGGDLVILYSAMTTDRDFLATPWMVMHSIFDSNNLSDSLVPGFNSLNAFLVYGGEEEDGFDDIAIFNNANDNSSVTSALVSTLTMASARNERIGSASDALAEMMCQELLTKGGLRLNLDALSVQGNMSASDDELRGSIKSLARHVKRMADDFRRNARGKLIVTSTN